MAYDFDGSTHYLQSGANTAGFANEPLTFAIWFQADINTAAEQIFGTGEDASTNNAFRLLVRGDLAGDPVQFITRQTAADDTVNTSTGFTVGTWHHACGIAAATNDRRVFIDGGSKGTDTSTTDVAIGNSSISIGAWRANGSTFNPFNGRLAEAGIWTVALTDEEVLSLARGMSPLLVRPQSLVFYAPIVRGLGDVKGGLTLTASGATVATHPRVIMPKKRQPYSVAAAGGGGLVGPLMRGRLIRGGALRGVLVR